MLYVGLYCDSLRCAWRIGGINGSDKDACLSTNVSWFSPNEVRVDDWG